MLYIYIKIFSYKEQKNGAYNYIEYRYSYKKIVLKSRVKYGDFEMNRWPSTTILPSIEV